jgi:transposase
LKKKLEKMRVKKKNHLTVQQKAKIVGMADGGTTTSQISHTYNIPRSTVQSVLEQNKARNTVERAKGSGCPMKTTDHNHQELKQLLETNRKTKLSNITDMMTTKILTQTAQKRIRNLGYSNRVAVKKPFVNKIQAKKTTCFCPQAPQLDRC